jgi:hypothetical protein
MINAIVSQTRVSLVIRRARGALAGGKCIANLADIETPEVAFDLANQPFAARNARPFSMATALAVLNVSALSITLRERETPGHRPMGSERASPLLWYLALILCAALICAAPLLGGSPLSVVG